MLEMNDIGPFIAIGAQGIFYVTTLIFIAFSLSIIYHWFAYGIHKAKVLILLAVYLGVSSVLFIGMSLALNAL